MSFGASDYRSGALERLAEAFTLLRAEQFAGSVYLAGRAVEGMLRAVIWTKDSEIRTGRKTLTTGHDLRQLLTLVRNLGLIRPNESLSFQERVHRVALLWFNDLRFASRRFIEARWRMLGYVTHRHTVKRAAMEYFEDCDAIIRRAEALCKG